MKISAYLLISLLIISCKNDAGQENLPDLLDDMTSIEGKREYLDSPYVTAGNRVYMVGQQDGSFPEIGWHIKGEMGGIWNHPIKLMDGFDAELRFAEDRTPLDQADKFINYPLANVQQYSLSQYQLTVERWQIVPDDKEGIAIQYIFQNQGDKTLEFDLKLTAHADLRPTWLGEETGMTDSPDSAKYEAGRWIYKDENNPWFAVLGADREAASTAEVSSKYKGKGISSTMAFPLKIPPGKKDRLTLVISGSYTSEEEALATQEDIHRNLESLTLAKKNRYRELASKSKLSIPDSTLSQTFEWLKYNSDWLVRTVPEIGTGITAGIPDYPWWFGVDSEYALKGYMAVGQWEAAMETIALLDSVSEAVNGNGRIIHEMSTNGKVFNPGNINETPQFASLIWETYKWTGDREFLATYYPTIKKGLHWLMSENDANNNLFPDGFGMMEIHGLNSEMIDVASYTQRAFADAAMMAEELDDEAKATEYREMATTLAKKINEEFWSAEFNSYADFIGTDEQALHLIEDAIVRADTLNKPWAVKELERSRDKIKKSPSEEASPFVLHHNWVVNTPMEMGIADSVKAITALDTAEKFVNPFGVFVTGIDRDESAGIDEGSFKGSKVFSYTGAVMTLPTGVQAVAENNYGRPDKALDYLQRMARTFSYALPGSMYEVSPDYGMIVQAWNIYSFAVPIVQQFFGISPGAHKKIVRINPQMPSSWNDAALENVRVGDNMISVYFKREGKQEILTVTQSATDWTLELGAENNPGVEYEFLEGNAMQGEDGVLRSSDQKVVLRKHFP